MLRLAEILPNAGASSVLRILASTHTLVAFNIISVFWKHIDRRVSCDHRALRLHSSPLGLIPVQVCISFFCRVGLVGSREASFHPSRYPTRYCNLRRSWRVQMFRAESTLLRFFPAVLHATQPPPLFAVELLFDSLWGDDDLSLFGSLVIFEFDSWPPCQRGIVVRCEGWGVGLCCDGLWWGGRGLCMM